MKLPSRHSERLGNSYTPAIVVRVARTKTMRLEGRAAQRWKMRNMFRI